MALVLAALAGTVMGTQYVSAWYHGHHGHYGQCGYSSGGGGGYSSGGGGGGGY